METTAIAIFYMTRGDDESKDIYEEDAAGLIPYVAGDTVEFMVKSSYNDDDSAALIHKTITTFTDGIAKLYLVPADTASMPFGKYYFDVQRRRQGGEKKTTVKGTFVLDWEVNHG